MNTLGLLTSELLPLALFETCPYAAQLAWKGASAEIRSRRFSFPQLVRIGEVMNLPIVFFKILAEDTQMIVFNVFLRAR